MSTDNKRINGVWSGPELTAIEKLSIRSFQDMGHEFHLYLTEPTKGIPDGTWIHSAYDIVPEESRSWFTGPNHFSDYFRANLIYKIGGWYVDVDTVCLKYFDFEEPYVFISECATGGASEIIDLNYLSGCVFKAPPEAPIIKGILDEINQRDPRQGCGLSTHLSDINLGIGPPMFRRMVPKFELTSYIKPPVIFDCLNWHEYVRFAYDQPWTLDERAYAVHLRSSFWRGNDTLVPDRKYPPTSFYEVLKRKHNVG